MVSTSKFLNSSPANLASRVLSRVACYSIQECHSRSIRDQMWETRSNDTADGVERGVQFKVKGFVPQKGNNTKKEKPKNPTGGSNKKQ